MILQSEQKLTVFFLMYGRVVNLIHIPSEVSKLKKNLIVVLKNIAVAEAH